MKNEKNITMLERIIEIQFVIFSATSCPTKFASSTIEVIPSKVNRRYSCTLNL
jgi:phage terminase Nu1 subunit (DNA packaging protein)